MNPRIVSLCCSSLLAVLVPFVPVTAAGAEPPMPVYEVVLQNGRIVDGTGAPWYIGDVAVHEGTIVRIGRIPAEAGKRVIDCTGLVIAPGFVDMMGQTASPFLKNPEAALSLLTQGITTINAGEGVSAAPLDEASAAKAGWRTMAQYFRLLEEHGLPINVVQTVGHTQVREIVLGDVDRRPSPEELERMQGLVREAMDAGAIGLSTALIYPPAVYATTEEIAALAAVAGKSGGRYYTHMRNEGDHLLEAIDEALEIGQSAGVPVHIFHLKAAGRQNWEKMDEAIAKIHAARAEGRQVTADVYPYINNGLGLAAFIHPRHFARGAAPFLRTLGDPQVRNEVRNEMENREGWENWFRHVGKDWNNVVLGNMSIEPYAGHNGKSLAAIAAALGRDEWDVFFDVVARADAFALPESLSEENVMQAMRQEFTSFCTDVGPAQGSSISAHPRAWGSFPRILARYVREKNVLSLERAVAQMSAVAANEVMAYDRGRIAVGQAADLVVFDAERIEDRATLAEPSRPSTGVHYVLVNGSLVLEEGRYTGAKPGRVLRGPGYRP